MMPKHFICDLDGTIADCSHRLPLIAEKPKKWDEFHAGCVDDARIHDIADIVVTLCERDRYSPIYVTGRPRSSEQSTNRWLAEHGFPVGGLYMRKTGDYRHDWIVKSEILDEILAVVPKIYFALEDRAQVVKMWRERGIRCLQVCEGDY